MNDLFPLYINAYVYVFYVQCIEFLQCVASTVFAFVIYLYIFYLQCIFKLLSSWGEISQSNEQQQCWSRPLHRKDEGRGHDSVVSEHWLQHWASMGQDE